MQTEYRLLPTLMQRVTLNQTSIGDELWFAMPKDQNYEKLRGPVVVADPIAGTVRYKGWPRMDPQPVGTWLVSWFKVTS